jgi:tape measure domain-containing protein
MKMGLTAVMGSSKAAEKQFQRLKEVAKLPGLGLQEAVAGATRLQVAGTSAQDAATQLQAFGRAVARAGGRRPELARVVEQIAQMASTSEVLMADFRPIVSIMPDIVTAMDSAFGTKQIEQIREMGITSKQFISGVTNELLKLPSVGNTAANSIENLTDEVFELRAQLGEVLLPTVSKLTDMLSKVVNWFNQLSDTQKSVITWGTAITAVLAALATAISGIALALPSLIAGFTTLGAILGPLSLGAAAPLVAVAASITGLIILFTKLNKQMDASEYTTRKLNRALKELSKTELDREIQSVRKEIISLEKELQDMGSVKSGLLMGVQVGLQTAGITASSSFSEATVRLKELRHVLKGLQSEFGGRKIFGPPVLPTQPTAMPQYGPPQKATGYLKYLSDQFRENEKILAKHEKESLEIRQEYAEKYALYNLQQTRSNLETYNLKKKFEEAESVKQLQQRIREHNRQFREQEAKEEEANVQRRLKLLQRIIEYNRTLRQTQQENFENLNDNTKEFGNLVAHVMRGWAQITHEETQKISTDVEMAVNRMSDIIAELPFNLAEAFLTGKQTVGEAIKSFFGSIGQLILRETQKIVATKIATGVMGTIGSGGLSAIGGSVLGGIAPVLGGIAPFALPALMGGLLLKDALGFDNPRNDYQARLSGMRMASQNLGHRSADDLIANFSQGFMQRSQAITQQPTVNVEPRFQLFIDGKQVHAAVKRIDDKVTTRGQAY